MVDAALGAALAVIRDRVLAVRTGSFEKLVVRWSSLRRGRLQY